MPANNCCAVSAINNRSVSGIRVVSFRGGRFHKGLLLVMFYCLLPAMVSIAAAGDGPSDPRMLFRMHYEAVGGLERLKNLKTGYSEGVIVFDGMEGRFKQWDAHPVAFLLEEDYGIFRQSSGDDGATAWVEDVNGKVLVERDRETMDRRAVQIRLENFEHLDPRSDFFTLIGEGRETIDGRNCRVVRMTNRLNSDVSRFYFDSQTFLLRLLIVRQPDIEIHTRYANHREIGGLVHACYEVTRIRPLDREIRVVTERFLPNPDIPAGTFRIPPDRAADVAFEAGDRALDIPFEFIENSIYLPVRMNCDTRLWLLDSGASMSVIDTGFAAGIGLTPRGRLKGHGYGDHFDLAFVTLPPFQVGGVRVDSQTVFTHQGLAEGFHDPPAVGILGFDFLSRFVTRIDYDRRTVSFYTPETFEYNGPGVCIAAPLKYKTFCLEAVVDGKYRGKWTIDLGAFSSSFNYPFASGNGLLGKKGFERLSRGMAGVHRERMVRFKTFQVGGFTIDHPVIGVPTVADSGAGVRAETIGNIGNSLLRHFIVHLDYNRQEVILEPGRGFQQTPETDKSGLTMGWTESGYPVAVLVAPQSGAEAAGIQPGDAILAVNGIDLTYFAGLRPIVRLFREKSGTRYTLRLRRQDRIIETILELKDPP
ncbi:MAG: aspartyl protease family protein [Thermodesulfobacteriota bacterium]